MKGGTLEVLVVSAEGVGHTNLIGNPEEIFWNEKFVFELPTPEIEELLYLKIQIMDKEFFTDGGLVGETTIHLKGVVTEGEDKGEADITPTPYNVILEDGAYKGQISIGLKYISKTVVEVERGVVQKRDEKDENGVLPSSSILKKISNLWKLSWRRILLFCSKNNNLSDS